MAKAHGNDRRVRTAQVRLFGCRRMECVTKYFLREHARKALLFFPILFYENHSFFFVFALFTNRRETTQIRIQPMMIMSVKYHLFAHLTIKICNFAFPPECKINKNETRKKREREREREGERDVQPRQIQITLFQWACAASLATCFRIVHSKSFKKRVKICLYLKLVAASMHNFSSTRA